MKETILEKVSTEILVKPKIGFVGVGWIGLNRMDAITRTTLCEAAAIADPNEQFSLRAKELAPGAAVVSDIDSLLDMDLDAVVIATPSALHAEHAIKALEKGLSVFCQKPLGRNTSETISVINTAKKADKLISVDLSYRYVKGIQKIKEILDNGEIGKVYGVNLVFHNAYGPDKSWFYDPALSGGGCIIDLGIHLIDLVLWIFNFPEVKNISARLFSNGIPFDNGRNKVEDYASVHFDLTNDAAVNLTCSWKISAGQDAVIEASFYGTEGGVSLKNINGSYYDFITEKYNWTAKQVIAEPPDNWGIGAAVNWVKHLVNNNKYDPEIENIIKVTEVIDTIYGNK